MVVLPVPTSPVIWTNPPCSFTPYRRWANASSWRGVRDTNPGSGVVEKGHSVNWKYDRDIKAQSGAGGKAAAAPYHTRGHRWRAASSRPAPTLLSFYSMFRIEPCHENS